MLIDVGNLFSGDPFLTLSQTEMLLKGSTSDLFQKNRFESKVATFSKKGIEKTQN